MRTIHTILLAGIWGAIAHPLGAPIARLFMSGKATIADSDFFGVLFSAGPYLTLMIALAILVSVWPECPPLRWAQLTGFVAGGLLLLVAQVFCWNEVHTDAQGALLFVFVPAYAILIAALIAFAVLVGGSLFIVLAGPLASLRARLRSR